MATKEQWVKWVREGQTENTIPEKPFEVQTGWYQLKDSKLIPINVEVPKVLPSNETQEEREARMDRIFAKLGNGGQPAADNGCCCHCCMLS
ncbi:hypothetical protein Ciccas_010186 [Cichlidogyrus casuarinus]|uniref:Uncharacterized protein n=1 Tax=Cichlidogyrus casuarinus TaxID=1844966 RepID=A0ABD2PUV7_9PLAT